MAARHWTPEQRAQQSKKIRQWQPWNSATGARTPEGKATASRNAFKGGVRAMMRGMSALLREQREFMKRIK
jgi:hypothetical protein